MARSTLLRIGVLVLLVVLGRMTTVGATPSFDAGTSILGVFVSSTNITGHVTTTQANRYASYGCALRDGVATVTAITHGGSATFVGAARGAGASFNIAVELWEQVAPPTGLVTMTFDFSDAIQSVCGISTFYGVHQSVPRGAVATAGGVSTTPSVSVLSVAGDLVIDVLGAQQDTAIGLGAGQATNWTNGDLDQNLQGSSSRETASGTSTVMGGTLASSEAWNAIGLALKDAIVAGRRRIIHVFP
jgi:hypothetical protein